MEFDTGRISTRRPGCTTGPIWRHHVTDDVASLIGSGLITLIFTLVGAALLPFAYATLARFGVVAAWRPPAVVQFGGLEGGFILLSFAIPAVGVGFGFAREFAWVILVKLTRFDRPIDGRFAGRRDRGERPISDGQLSALLLKSFI